MKEERNPMHGLISGASAGVVASVVCAPLDLAKVQFNFCDIVIFEEFEQWTYVYILCLQMCHHSYEVKVTDWFYCIGSTTSTRRTCDE